MSRSKPNYLRLGDRVLTAALGAAAGVLISRNFFLTERKIEQLLQPSFSAGDPEFVRTMSQLLGPPLLGGNTVTPLRNGKEIFPAMLRAIMDAKTSITFENFVWSEGHVTMQFAEALAERACAGVKVHVLQDALGCGQLDGPSLCKMRDCSIELEIFRLYGLTRLNQRTHRKLLVIDGRIGFTGGVAISDDWDGEFDEPHHWREMQYRVEGPVVGQMQQAFLENWMETRACVLMGDEYFPELKPVGTQICQVFKSSATEGADSARLMVLLSLASARHTIRIANAYFLPDDLTIRTLLDARRRGVEIEVITAGPLIDQRLVRMVGRSRWTELIAAGVRFYEFDPARYHCKYLLIDDCWASVGSTNLDDRSLRLNEEANLNVLDHDFVANHIKIFEDDKQLSRPISLREWEGRSVSEKIYAKLGSVFRSQM